MQYFKGLWQISRPPRFLDSKSHQSKWIRYCGHLCRPTVWTLLKFIPGLWHTEVYCGYALRPCKDFLLVLLQYCCCRCYRLRSGNGVLVQNAGYSWHYRVHWAVGAGWSVVASHHTLGSCDICKNKYNNIQCHTRTGINPSQIPRRSDRRTNEQPRSFEVTADDGGEAKDEDDFKPILFHSETAGDWYNDDLPAGKHRGLGLDEDSSQLLVVVVHVISDSSTTDGSRRHRNSHLLFYLHKQRWVAHWLTSKYLALFLNC